MAANGFRNCWHLCLKTVYSIMVPKRKIHIAHLLFVRGHPNLNLKANPIWLPWIMKNKISNFSGNFHWSYQVKQKTFLIEIKGKFSHLDFNILNSSHHSYGKENQNNCRIIAFQYWPFRWLDSRRSSNVNKTGHFPPCNQITWKVLSKNLMIKREKISKVRM